MFLKLENDFGERQVKKNIYIFFNEQNGEKL